MYAKTDYSRITSNTDPAWPQLSNCNFRFCATAPLCILNYREYPTDPISTQNITPDVYTIASWRGDLLYPILSSHLYPQEYYTPVVISNMLGETVWEVLGATYSAIYEYPETEQLPNQTNI